MVKLQKLILFLIMRKLKPRSILRIGRYLGIFLGLIFILGLVISPLKAQDGLPLTEIKNQAKISYSDQDGNQYEVSSNEITTSLVTSPTPSPTPTSSPSPSPTLTPTPSSSPSPSPKDKITICHYTTSTTSPYIKITIDVGDLKEHQDHGDIIPAAGDDCPKSLPTPTSSPGTTTSSPGTTAGSSSGRTQTTSKKITSTPTPTPSPTETTIIPTELIPSEVYEAAGIPTPTPSPAVATASTPSPSPSPSPKMSPTPIFSPLIKKSPAQIAQGPTQSQKTSQGGILGGLMAGLKGNIGLIIIVSLTLISGLTALVLFIRQKFNI